MNKKIIYGLLIPVVLLIIFLPFITDSYLYVGDPSAIIIPSWDLIARAIKKFDFLTWTPLMECGYPIIANPQLSTIFYPIHLICFLLFNAYHAYTVAVLLQIILALWFQYIFSRYVGLSPLASGVSACIFSFSSMMFGGNIHTQIWMPLLAYCLMRGLTEQSLSLIVCAAIVSAVQMFGGSPQLWFNTQIAMTIIVIFLVIRSPYSARYHVIVLAGTFYIFVMGLIAVQLLPMFELNAWVGRAENIMTVKEMSNYPFHPIKDTFMLFFPNIFGPLNIGNSIESWGYVGSIALFLSLVAWIFRKGKPALTIFLWIAVIGFILSLGSKNLIFYLLVKLPGFSNFRYPIRYFIISVFAISVLAGFGIDVLRNARADAYERIILLFKKYICFLIALLLLAFIIKIGKPWWPPIILQKLRFGYFDHMNTVSYSVLFIFLLSVCVFLIMRRKKIPLIVFLWSIIGISFFQLIYNDLKYANTISSHYFLDEPSTAAFLKKQNPLTSTYRIFTEISLSDVFRFDLNKPNRETYTLHKELIMPNQHVYYGLQTINRSTSIPIKRNNFLFYKYLYPAWASHDHRTTSQILSLLSVKYIVTTYPVPSSWYKKMYENNGFYIYYNNNALPMAYYADTLVYQPDEDKIPSFLIDIRKGAEAVIETRPFKEGWNKQNGYYKFSFKKWKKSKIVDLPIISMQSSYSMEIKTNVPEQRLLVLNYNYYPGWKVLVDGISKELLRVNYTFQGVIIDPGRHTVKFTYVPRMLIIGAVISTLFLIISVIILFLGRYTFIRSKEV